MKDTNYDFFIRNMPKVLPSDASKPQEFNPFRIKKSILKETSINRDTDHPEEIADEIVKNVCRILLDLKINKGYDLVTARYIREVVCSILQQYNRKWRSEYTTMGIPYADFKRDFGHLFDDIEKWEDVDGIYSKIIGTINSAEVINLIFRIVRDYIGVRNDIKDFESNDKK